MKLFLNLSLIEQQSAGNKRVIRDINALSM